MSEQNQMAISPITAGLTGAVVGGAGGYFIKGLQPVQSEYKDVKNLLTMDADKFEPVKNAAKDVEGDLKTAYTTLEEGRRIVSSAGEELIKSQNTARAEMNAAIEKDLEKNLSGDDKTKFTDAIKTEKADLDAAQKTVTDKATELKTARADANSELAKKTAEFKKAYEDEVTAIKGKKDSGLGKDLAELEDKLAKETDATKKADIEKQIKAKNTEISKEALKKDTVANAQKAMREEKANIIKADDLKTNAKTLADKKKAYNEKLIASADEALKGTTAKKDGTALEQLKALIEEKKAILAKKVDDVKAEKAGKLMEDAKYKDLNVKGLLPKAKMWPAIIGAAALGLAGVALAYVVGPKNPTPTDVA